jgi:uncharacterized damage-inducible protein DinB
MLTRLVLGLALAASPALAQAPSATSQARELWQGVTGYLVEAANDMPENLYSFRPTPEVRTFGELIAHVAGAQRMFCAMAMGEKPPAESAVEQQARTKAAIVSALKESNTYCDRAYSQADAATSGTVEVFGQQRTKLYALLMNATHDNEHYGNVVTYLRMNKMIPPSSKPGR